MPRQTKHTLKEAESRGGFIILIFLLSVKWLVVFYYTYNNEEDVYIHPEDPFRKTAHSTHDAEARTNCGRDECYR